MRNHEDRIEIEHQCQEIFGQEIFAAGDFVVSGPLLLLEDGPLVIATKWEPVSAHLLTNTNDL